MDFKKSFFITKGGAWKFMKMISEQRIREERTQMDMRTAESLVVACVKDLRIVKINLASKQSKRAEVRYSLRQQHKERK